MKTIDLARRSMSDERGSIEQLELHGAEFNLLYSKKGALRSGDVHPNTQFDLILKGKVQVRMKRGEREEIITAQPNELLAIPAGVPHLFEFLEDCVMIEWWDGPFQAEYYAPYRDLVEQKMRTSEPKLND